MKLKHFIIVLMGMVLLTALGGCKETDDTTEIFTGKLWHMTYNPNTMRELLTGDDETNTKTVDEISQNNNCTLQLNGATTDGVINGAFSVTATNVSFTGTWSADGTTHKMTFTIPAAYQNATDQNELGQELLVCLKNIDRYEGNANGLLLYYTKNGASKYLGFTPKN